MRFLYPGSTPGPIANGKGYPPLLSSGKWWVPLPNVWERGDPDSRLDVAQVGVGSIPTSPSIYYRVSGRVDECA